MVDYRVTFFPGYICINKSNKALSQVVVSIIKLFFNRIGSPVTLNRTLYDDRGRLSLYVTLMIPNVESIDIMNI